MIKFIGTYSAKLDDRGRLVFPSAFKSLIDDGRPMQFVVKKDIFAPCLNIFTYQEWERESESVKSRLNFFNIEHARFWRGYMSSRALIEPDGKLGRITIPKKMLEEIGVSKEVVFEGCDHKIELWSKEEWDRSTMENDDFAALAQHILGGESPSGPAEIDN